MRSGDGKKRWGRLRRLLKMLGIVAIFRWLASLLRPSLPVTDELPEIKVDLLTYREVVRYFTEDRPTDPTIVGGALLRKRKRTRTSPRYEQLFINDKEQPVTDGSGEMYGRSVRAAQVDDELAAAFGSPDNDLVIFR